MREPEPRDRDRPATPDETITTLARPAAQVVPEDVLAIHGDFNHGYVVHIRGLINGVTGPDWQSALDRARVERDGGAS